MRQFLFGVMLLIGLIAGCVESKDTRGGAPSTAMQPEAARLDALFSHPSPDSIPGGQRGEQIRLGYELVEHTQEFAAPYVGNRLTCANCHLDAGLDPNSASFVGLLRLRYLGGDGPGYLRRLTRSKPRALVIAHTTAE